MGLIIFGPNFITGLNFAAGFITGLNFITGPHFRSIALFGGKSFHSSRAYQLKHTRSHPRNPYFISFHLLHLLREMNFHRATPLIQDLPGFPTQIPSRTRFWLNQNAIVQDALNGALNPPDVLKMIGEMGFIFRSLVQTEDEIKKYPRNEEDMWALYGLPVESVRDAVGVTVKTLKEKAWEFGEHRNWPPSSSGTMLTILAQGHDGIVTRRHLFRVPSYRTFQNLKAQILNHFNFQHHEEFTLYFELEGLRRGPILDQLQWARVVRLRLNRHKINV